VLRKVYPVRQGEKAEDGIANQQLFYNISNWKMGYKLIYWETDVGTQAILLFNSC
jgi:hypothetical protein